MGMAALATDQDSKDDDMQATERVTLMTAHAAKGLEFNNVFVVGVEEDLFPSAMANSSLREIEEERRLLYVAITRAKRFCMLSYATTRFRNGQTVWPSPSRFISDIDPAFICKASAQSEPVDPIPAYTPRNLTPIAPKPSRPAAGPAPETPPVGARIEHPKFGLGTVTAIDDSMADTRITVDFENAGQRTLLLKFAKFTLL